MEQQVNPDNKVTAIITADHFYTIPLDERDNAIATFGYHGEGILGYLSGVSPSGLSAFYRLEGGQVGDHFYTTSLEERDNAITALGYHSEQIACYVYPMQIAGTVALHRLASSTHHFYTTSDSERDNAIANLGFHSEGEAGYVFSEPSPGTTPLFRLVNPQQGDHFYTISANERDNAIASFGYQDEGIACHVFGSDPSSLSPVYRLLYSPNRRPIRKLPFSPAVNGFAFVNSWQFDDFEKERIQEALAAALVTATTSLAPLLVPIVAPAIGIADALGALFGIPPGSIEIAAGTIAIDEIKGLIDKKFKETYGLCGGMAWASLDYYLTGLQIPRQFTTPPVRPGGAVLRDYIWTRLLDTMIEGGVAITTMEWIIILKFDALGGAGELLKRTINEWQTLKTRIDMGFPVPIVLIGTTTNPMVDHQVLAYGYEDNGDNTGKLYIYDNDVPNQEVTWLLNFNGPTLIADEGLSKHDGRGPLQGFFCSNYSLNPHPPVIPFQTRNGSISGKKIGLDSANNSFPGAGWTITLIKPDGTTMSTTTDANGNYSFTDLPPGIYTVAEVMKPPLGLWVQREPPIPPGTHTVTITSAGENITGKDFINQENIL
jgi:hypothetical protein